MISEEELLSIVPTPSIPPFFDGYWESTLTELAATPIVWERAEEPDLPADGYDGYAIKMDAFEGISIYAWMAVPKGVTDPMPGYLWLPGYSLGNPPPGPESLYEGVVTMGVNIHGNTPDTPYVHPSKLRRDYITIGIESQRTYIFRTLVSNCVRAFEVLAEQPEVDANKMVVGGMSQGGGLALIVASLLQDRVKLCFADMPWLCDLDRALSLIDWERYTGTNLPQDARHYIKALAERHPDEAEAIYKTYRYFDPLSHASRIISPTQMSAGGRDPSCKPQTIYSVYNALTCDKEIQYLSDTGHEIVPAMHEAHANWLLSRLQ